MLTAAIHLRSAIILELYSKGYHIEIKKLNQLNPFSNYLDNLKDLNYSYFALTLEYYLNHSETLSCLFDDIIINQIENKLDNKNKTFNDDKKTDKERILTYISTLPNIQATIILSAILPYTINLNNKALSITIGALFQTASPTILSAISPYWLLEASMYLILALYSLPLYLITSHYIFIILQVI